MKLLDEYNSVRQAIFDYFGYKEDWVVLPLDDARDFFWQLDQSESGGGEVRYAFTREDLLDIAAGNYYDSSIYTQQFLPKWVYRGPEFTMIVVDTHTDGNKFLQIFDNSKEVK